MSNKRSPVMQGLIDKGATQLDDQIDVQNVAESDLGKVAADEAFMHQTLEVLLYPTTNPNEPPYADVSVNGHRAIIPRNRPVQVLRKHVEVLARMKETRVTQSMTPDANGEITMNSLRGHTGLVYPFQCLKDPDPRGPAWLANCLAERG